MVKTVSGYFSGFLVIMFALVFGLVIHEFSHMFVALVSGGYVSELHFGLTSYVVSHTDQQYYPYISMASIVIPAFFLLFSFYPYRQIIRKWMSRFWFGYSVLATITCLMNLGAVVFYKVANHSSWDLLIAMDYASPVGKIICVVVTALCMKVSAASLTKQFLYMIDTPL